MTKSSKKIIMYGKILLGIGIFTAGIIIYMNWETEQHPKAPFIKKNYNKILNDRRASALQARLLLLPPTGSPST